MKLEDAIAKLSDVMGRPIAFVALTCASVVGAIVGAVVGFDGTYGMVFNLSISIITMIIGQAVLVSSRRETLASSFKLDKLIEWGPGSNDAIGAEKEDTEVLEQKIEEVEQNCS